MCMQTEDDFVGYKYPTTKGSTITVVGKCTEFNERGAQYYYSVCSICSCDKELWPEPFRRLKFAYTKHKVFCDCREGRSPEYTQEQYNILLSRKSEEKGQDLKLVRVNTEGKIGMASKLTLVCKKGHTVHTPSVFKYLKDKATCSQCAKDAASENRTYIDWVNFSSTTPKGGVYKVTKVETRFLYVTCSICSLDKELYPKPFRIYKSNPTIPCGCGHSPRRSKRQFEVLCERASNITGNTYLGMHGQYDGSRTKVRQYCDDHGMWDSSTVDTLIYSRGGCPSCVEESNSFGMYKDRVEHEDYLYLLILYNEDESFIKVGRSFRLHQRFQEYRRLYDVEILAVKKATHQEVFDEECYIKRTLKHSRYSPNNPFGGSIRECFTIDQLDYINTHFEGCFDSEITQQYRDLTNL